MVLCEGDEAQQKVSAQIIRALYGTQTLDLYENMDEPLAQSYSIQ